MQEGHLYSGWSSIALGGNHSCGISAGKAYCWGNNSYGQLGDTTFVDKKLSTQVG